jgi:molecular chaperone GrpE
LRLYSEFDNYRKRTNKEKIELISTASAGVLKDMLSVMDDFERAIANNET